MSAIEIKLNKLTNQSVNDGVAHSKNPRKCTYHVTFDLDLDLEHTLLWDGSPINSYTLLYPFFTLDPGLPGDHRVQVWWQSGHLSERRSDLRKSLQTDRWTDRRRTPCHCISSFLEWAKNEVAHIIAARSLNYLTIRLSVFCKLWLP